MLAVLLVCGLASGCAIAHAPLPVEPHLEGVVPPEAGRRPVLGVAPLRDVRPRISRHPTAPEIDLVWAGIVRRGDRQTGDDSFVGDVRAGARADLVAVLARSGAFRRVRAVDGFEPGVDLLLVAQLEELVGSTFQELELNLLRIGFVRLRSGPTRGIARIRVRIEDRVRKRYEDVIEVQHRATSGTRGRAALDALALAHERLADALFRELVRERAPVRRVAVRLLDGCGLGRKRALRRLADASEIFDREADLRLEGRAETWTPPPRARAHDEVLQSVRALIPPVDGFVLALFSPTEALALGPDRRRAGTAVQLGEHAIVACERDGHVRASTIAHEVGHLFGAVHTRERASIMHTVDEFDGRFFDPLNRNVLRTTRLRPFGRALDPLRAAKLRALYRIAGGEPETYAAQDVERALSAVEAGGGR